jgi:hypothetical protein
MPSLAEISYDVKNPHLELPEQQRSQDPGVAHIIEREY